MARKVWTFELEDGSHSVELEHGYFSGERKIRVDGKILEQPTRKRLAWFDLGSDHPFQIGGHACIVQVRTNGLTFRYDLGVDDRSVQSGKELKPALPLPSWAWVFIAACVLIPVIALGGAIPAMLGAAGAWGCTSIARDSTRSARMRVVLCIGLTVLCWAAFLVFAGMIGRVLPPV